MDLENVHVTKGIIDCKLYENPGGKIFTIYSLQNPTRV